MTNWKELEKRFAARLALGRRPVAVTFLDAEPAGIPKFSGTEPAGCSFWRLAAAGRTFYTVPADHFNCAVGAYTHNIQLPPDRVQETETTLGMMFNLGYVRPEEVPGIPRLAQGACGGCLRAARGCARGAQRRAVRVQDFRGDAAQRSFHPRRRQQLAAAARPAVVHGASRGARARNRFDASAASAIACTPAWARTKCMSSCRARSWKPSPTRWESSPSANAALEEYARGRQASLSTV